jgi:hypothetical protein
VVKRADEVLVVIKLFANEESSAALKRLAGDIKGLALDYGKLASCPI